MNWNDLVMVFLLEFDQRVLQIMTVYILFPDEIIANSEPKWHLSIQNPNDIYHQTGSPFLVKSFTLH